MDIYHPPVIYVMVIGDRKVQLELNLKAHASAMYLDDAKQVGKEK